MVLVTLQSMAKPSNAEGQFPSSWNMELQDFMKGLHRSPRSFEELYKASGNRDTDVLPSGMISKRSFSNLVSPWMRTGGGVYGGGVGGRRRQSPCRWGDCSRGGSQWPKYENRECQCGFLVLYERKQCCQSKGLCC
ncbi:hypothetical protein FHG87_000767 [Trinorchestia longiramus]|nr:hypothetical protein FHG87_000767 [Trinorchestia longiramus]